MIEVNVSLIVQAVAAAAIVWYLRQLPAIKTQLVQLNGKLDTKLAEVNGRVDVVSARLDERTNGRRKAKR